MAERQGSDIHNPQSTTHGDRGRVLQGSVHQRRYPSKVPDATHMELPVTLDNYKAKFTALLYYEEQEHIELLKKKCDGYYTLKKCQPPFLRYDEEDHPNHFYCLQGMSSAQIMYATQASDRHVTISIGQRSYVASILSCNYSHIDDKLYICFNQRGESIDSIRDQFPLKVNAKFDVNHSYFVGLNEGVMRISMSVLRRLMPTPEDFKSPPRSISINIRRHPHGGIDLDPEQYPALKALLSNQCSAPVLVPGAFGCGKTRLLAVATECFFREHRKAGHPSLCRILICCHHQHSADVFMDSYFNKMLTYKKHPWPVKVVRVTSSRHRVDYPGYGQAPDYVQAGQFDNSPYKNENSFLLVTTFGGALKISKQIDPDFFTHILIDEGAQTREPEALSPFLMANENTRIVIAGDHQQVGPQLLVLGKAPQQFGLCVSLLQRLLEKYKSIGDITKRNTSSWNINYRSQAELLELPSKLFYNSELKACNRVPYHLKAPYPYVFIYSSFTNDIPVDAQCAVEADRLLQAVQLHSDKFKSWELKDTCIMTPSLKQANLIKRLIKTEFKSLNGVNVITSYQMQGQEYRMLFMSTVESLEPNGRPFDPLKSFCNPALFNTAITRSKSLVVAVGNPLVLLLSEATMDNLKWCWREFISRCLKYETFKSAPSDRAQFEKVEAQFFRMLKCENPTDLIKLFQSKGYSETHSTKSLTHVLPIPLSTPHLPQRSIQPSQSPSIKDQSQVSAFSTNKISPARMQQPFKAALAPMKKKQCPAAKKQPSSHGNGLANDSLSHSTQPKNLSPQKHSGQPPNNSQSKQSPLGSQHLPIKSTPPQKPVHALSLKSTQRFPPDTAENTPEPCTDSTRSSDGQRKSMNIKAPYFQNSSKDSILEQFFMDHNHRPFDEELLTAKLKRQNYKEKFHQLLCREEEEHDRLLKERCDGFHALSIVKGRNFHKEINPNYMVFGQIVSERLDADAIAYAHQASEGKVLLDLPSGIVWADIVRPKKRDESCLFLGFSKYLDIKRPMQVYVTFVLKYSYFDRLHKAIDHLSSSVINRLVPADCSNFTMSTLKPTISSSYPDIISLDYSQSKALETIIKCESSKAPALVIGSFGTGKTRLLARSAYEILEKSERNRVLICAHHQHSADCFIIDYFAKICNRKWSSDVVRLIPSASFHYSKPALEKYCHTWHRFSEGKDRDVRLVVTTFSTSLHLYLYAHIKKGFFTHILIDEGAQTREPESVAPFCLADDNTQIVIAGDHKQVGPSLLVLGKTAIQYGLRQSLLERLHHAYNSKGLDHQINVFSHCSTLLTNFRCHHAILSLPSFLFYDSALMLGAEAVTRLHPLSNYPLHFICSGLTNEKEVHDNTNDSEVDLLLSQVKKYVNSWPKEWGLRNLSKVCVMTTTAHQKFKVSNALRNEVSPFKCLYGIEVKTVFDIQGCEYEAIFLSTAEPTTREGKSKNPTKTPCSQYVFNTALTRAKSLVVCAGNPFLLITIEESMDNECSCWKEYIRRCILSKTFVVPLALQRTNSDQIKVLQEMIFKSSINSNVHISTKDSILKSFQRALKSVPQYKYSKLQIIQEQSDSKWDIIKQDDSIVQHDDSEEGEGQKEGIVSCELQIQNPRLAVAIPLEQSKEPIVIHGFHNRRGAFNNDIVQVEVTSYTSVDDSSKEVIVKTSGKVVKVIEEQHPTRYVCRADQYGFINFYPLDKTAPIIVNLPKISWKLLRDGNQKGKMEEMESGRKGLRKIQSSVVHDYVTVFREESLSISNDDPKLPRIKELIPFELSQSLLFVVEVLGWNPKYRKALGAVIEAVPRTSNLFFTNRLLSLVYDIQEEDEEVDAPLQLPNETNELHHYNRAFTIDPSLSKDLDDAVSLTPLPKDGNFELAVLIANVAKHINENHPLDKKAKQRGTSVYGAKQTGCASNSIQRVYHMFPSSITSQLSLDHLKKRHVLCVPATVVIEEGVVTSVVSGNPKEAMVTSQVRFTYESAKKVMHDEVVDGETKRQVEAFNAASRPGFLMADILDLLYKIAMYLRIKRLRDAGYCYGQSEEGEEGNWQTHLLIEELMIFCNASIAEYLHERLPQQTALLRAQMPPLEGEKHDFIELNQNYMSHSLSLKCYLKDSSDEAGPFIMPSKTLQLLNDACSKDHIQLASILSNNKLYPQLAMAEAMSQLISRKASYVMIENSKEHICANHAHNSLALPSYTHFTSPIRRYFDLVVQRLVTSLIEEKPITENSELAKLCSQLNVRNKIAKDFEKADNKACITRRCEMSLERAEAFVIKSSKKSNDSFELSFTSTHYQCIHGRDTSFSLSDLNFHHTIEDGTTKSIVWKIVSISLRESFNLFSHPDVHVIDMTSASPKAPHFTIAAKMYQFEEKTAQIHFSKAKFAVCDKDITFSSERWLVTHQYLKCQNEDNFKKVESLILQLQQEASKDKPQSKKDEDSIAITYKIQRPFTVNDIVTVWLGKSLKECLPIPAIQLMEIAPTVRVCLQHNKNPSLCFSDIQLQKASRDTAYHSIEQYVELWSKVLIAESANESVKTKNLIFIRHAPLKWNEFTRVDNCVDDPYYLPNDISLVIPPKNQDSLDFISIKSGDFLCVRYEISDSLNAVYHFVVTLVKRNENKKANKKDDEDVVIKMKPQGDYSCRVTENMHQELKKGNQTCEIQLIPMPDSFHRVYGRLQEALIENEWSNRATTVAIADTRSKDFNMTAQHFEISLKVFNDNPLAKQLWKGESGTELNAAQKDSIKRALRNKFQLIQGPPGTGKSETGAHLAYIFSITNKEIHASEKDPMSCKKKSVLYCGPSNKSVDVVHKNLHLLNKKLRSNKLKILRIYGRTHERKDYPDPVFDLTQERTDGDDDDNDGRVLEVFRDESLHKRIRHNCPEIEATEKRLQGLVDGCIIPSLVERKNYKKLITSEEMKEIQNNYDVILCTCNETCSQRLLNSKDILAQCIIDESGMATEPETIAASSLCEHVVLIGDHKQLQPVIKYPPAKECGLGTSLFERYANQFEKTKDPHLITLKLQYRMHSFICRGPSSIFYDNKLKADQSVQRRRPLTPSLHSFWPKGQQYPVRFLTVYGIEQFSGFTDSKYSGKVDPHSKDNKQEAEAVLKCIKKLVKEHGVKHESIAVLTPYSAQKILVSEMIKKDPELKTKKSFRVATIIESQGDEYDIVILTTVRSQKVSEIRYKQYVQPDRRWLTENLGFLTDYHQINVGITRARYGLIIIGNDRLLRYDMTWDKLIKFYEDNGCVHDYKQF